MSVNPQPSACPGCEALAAELEFKYERLYEALCTLAGAEKETRRAVREIMEKDLPTPPPPTARERMAALGWEETRNRPVPAVAPVAPPAAGAGSRGAS